jgi:hypothetical protein
MTKQAEKTTEAKRVPIGGTIVHYVLHDGPNAGIARPAVVICADGDTVDLVALTVIHDGLGDRIIDRTATYSAKAEPGTWHWIEGEDQ